MEKEEAKESHAVPAAAASSAQPGMEEAKESRAAPATAANSAQPAPESAVEQQTKTVDDEVFDPVQWEHELLELWEQERTFEASVERNNKRDDSTEQPPPHFVFQDGPPTANGRPGLHHVLARAFKDLVCRYKTMQGFVVVRKAGWDCHGLPVERQVEKELGFQTARDVETFGVGRFNALCEASVWQYQQDWNKLTERMGYWCDTTNRYATLDQDYMESEWWALRQLWDKGLLQRRYQVLPYSPDSGCTYSNRDVSEGYRQVSDLSCLVRFPLMHQEEGEVSVVNMVVWTTTPWTLPANALLAVNKSLSYVFVKVSLRKASLYGNCESGDDNECEEMKNGEFEVGHFYFRTGEVLVVSRAQFTKLQQTLPSDSDLRLTAMREVRGAELVGQQYDPPFRTNSLDTTARRKERNGNIALLWQVVHADFVTEEKGTGTVHVAPMYGEDDFKLCVDLGCDLGRPEFQHVVGLDGRFFNGGHGRDDSGKDWESGLLPSPAPLRGLRVTSAETQEAVLRLLHEHGLLLQAEHCSHEYPHCWRNNAHRLVYYAMDSWFLIMSGPKVRDRMQELNDLPEVRFAPETLKNGKFGNWLRESRDWCVSRQRTWGCPLPVWECKKGMGGCGRQHCVGSRSELRGLLVIPNAWPDDQQMDLHAPEVDELQLRCPGCGNESGAMCREPYVLDCWFDSGCAPFAQWHYPFAFTSDPQQDLPSFAVGAYCGKEQYNGSVEHVLDFVAEGKDQCRGWFYSLLAVSSTVFDRAAFKQCLALGLLLDEDGSKMSKSKGNVVDPWNHFNQEGADALRWCLVRMCAPWADRRFNAKLVRVSNQNFFRVVYNVDKWWHLRWNEVQQGALHFDESWRCCDSFDEYKPRGVLNRWLLSRLASVVGDCNNHFENYNFHVAVACLERFVNEDFSKTFLRLSRAHFRLVPASSNCDEQHVRYAAKLSTRLESLQTMRFTLLMLYRLVAPVAPFLVDRLHRRLMETISSCPKAPVESGGRRESFSVHLAPWPTTDKLSCFGDRDAESHLILLQELVRMGREVHEKSTRPGRLPLAHGYWVVYDDSASFALAVGPSAKSSRNQDHPRLTKELVAFLAFELNMSKVTVLESRAEFETLLKEVEEPSLALDMSRLEARFKGNTPEVVTALQKALLGQSASFSFAVKSKLQDSKQDTEAADNTLLSTEKSRKQQKREQRAEDKRRKKEAARNVAAKAFTMRGPLVGDAVKRLQSDGVFKVQNNHGGFYELLANDFRVSTVPQSGFDMSVQSLTSETTDGAGEVSLTAGLVVDLGANPTLVSRYVSKEVTHAVQRWRKKYTKEQVENGELPLGKVSLRVVVCESASSDGRNCVVTHADWLVLLEETRADPGSSVLNHVACGNIFLREECQREMENGTSLEVRAFDESFAGCQVYFSCAPMDGN